MEASRREVGKPTLSILCPVHNEEEVIPLFFKRLHPVIEGLSSRYVVRLFFLNNASTDSSVSAMMQVGSEWRDTYIISMSRNVGYQRSIELGLRTVDSDVYVIIDVDCEDPPEMIDTFSQHLEDGAEIVYGLRTDRQEPRVLKECRRFFYRILQSVADEDILLDMAEFSMFTREVRNAVIQENSSFPFIRASIARVGYRRVGIPYARELRIGGRTHYNVPGMVIFALAGILASSTLLLRIPIFVFPLWVLFITVLAIIYASSQAVWAAAGIAWLGLVFLGFTAAVMALYIGRTYKNGLERPNAFLSMSTSKLPPEFNK
jgi:dolichol-phosphate mannosyltransferase